MALFDFLLPKKDKPAFTNKEYVYLFTLPTLEFTDSRITATDGKKALKESIQRFAQADLSVQAGVRENVIHFIQKDLSKYKKKLISSDALIGGNMSEEDPLLSYFIFASGDFQTNHFFKPLLYEIFAFTKKRDDTIFTYKYETLLFKNNNHTTNIKKFTVEC